jgi:hypothetical protein
MQSKNHQYVELSEQVVKRYVRTTLEPITGQRTDPLNPTIRVDWLLATPDKNYTYIPYTPEHTTQVRQDAFTYEDEVLELYSPAEVRVFQQLNRSLIEAGKLKEYTDVAPVIDTSNALTDIQVIKLASIKQLPAFRKELTAITSPQTLERVKAMAEALDRPTSIVKAVETRMEEIKNESNSS